MTPPSNSALHLVTGEERSLHSDTTELTSSSVRSSTALPTPTELRRRFPLSEHAMQRIREARARINARIEQGLGAPLAIVGPCSIHCETAALEYAERLAALQRRMGDSVQLVMRVYLEKPRTTVGWKGFLYDPDLDGTSDLSRGIERGRALMVQIAELGVPIATEILDPLSASYFEDCLSWVAIGARTSESQIHRQLASGLECAVGFKNGTDGSTTVATQAIEAAASSHTHLGIDDEGRVAMKNSRGNSACHVVLRGGRDGPNFDRESVRDVGDVLRKAGCRAAVLVDCSHGNSEKDYRRQPEVARQVIAQMKEGGVDVFGVMLESHLRSGKQPLDVNSGAGDLEYGVSVTDGCIDFSTTEALLFELGAR